MLPLQGCGTTLFAHIGVLQHGSCPIQVASGWSLLILGGNQMVPMNFWLHLDGYCSFVVVSRWLLLILGGI